MANPSAIDLGAAAPGRMLFRDGLHEDEYVHQGEEYVLQETTDVAASHPKIERDDHRTDPDNLRQATGMTKSDPKIATTQATRAAHSAHRRTAHALQQQAFQTIRAARAAQAKKENVRLQRELRHLRGASRRLRTKAREDRRRHHQEQVGWQNMNEQLQAENEQLQAENDMLRKRDEKYEKVLDEVRDGVWKVLASTARSSLEEKRR